MKLMNHLSVTSSSSLSSASLSLSVLGSMCSYRAVGISAWLAISTLSVQGQDLTLHQVHVITRHGARSHLSKNADSLAERNGATLTPLGEEQLYNLGTWLRETYKDMSPDFPLEVYNSTQVRLESSDTDRTLTSANALSLGLFPPMQAFQEESLLPSMISIPVYSRQEINDVYLRAYQNCPTFFDNLETLYESDAWVKLEQNNAGLLKKLGEIFPEEAGGRGSLDLKQLYNAYDQLHVARTECVDPTSFACNSLETPDLMNALSDTEFQDVESLMGRTEKMKFGPATGKNLLGSNLIWQIINRAILSDGKFFLYSAHAPTILGFLAALSQSIFDESFVDYGSAVIVEVYRKGTVTDETAIRVLYKAHRTDTISALPLEQAQCTYTESEVQYCALTKFISWAMKNTLHSEGLWCEACGNDQADVCLRDATSSSGGSMKNNPYNYGKSSSESAANDPLVIALTFFGGFVLGALMVGASCVMQSRDVNDAKDVMEGSNIEADAAPPVATVSAPTPMEQPPPTSQDADPELPVQPIT